MKMVKKADESDRLPLLTRRKNNLQLSSVTSGKVEEFQTEHASRIVRLKTF
jgi:hypothetical protein